MKKMQYTDDSPEILFHLRWVAKIALWVGATAGVGMAILLYVLTDTTGTNYGELIKSHSLTQYRLGPALLIGGFFLLAFTAILTWLIALYSSFRIAGPLFRLSKNLESSIGEESVKPVPIRASDRLHLEAALLEEALDTLATHYASLREDVDQVLLQIDAGASTTDDRLEISARLKKGLSRAQI